MSPRTVFLSLSFALVGLAAASAQTTDLPAPAMYKPPSADAGEITLQKLLADRLNFAKEVYALNDEQSKKIVPLLEQLVPLQEQYDLKVRLTLRRTALAISVAANAPANPETDHAGTMARLEAQIQAMHAEAPMSLANVIKLVDPLLPNGQVEAAHNRLRTEVAARLKKDAAAIDLAKIDYPLVPAVVPQGLASMQAPQPRPQTDQPQPPVQSTAKMPIPPPPPPEPPKPLKPAPALNQWTKDYDALVAKYKFTDDQKKVAGLALKSCLDRAAAHQEKHDPDKAQTPADKPADQTAANAPPLDRLYDELIQRVESLATTEQKLRAEGKLTSAPEPPPPPARNAQPQRAPAQAPTAPPATSPPPSRALPTPPPPPTTQPGKS